MAQMSSAPPLLTGRFAEAVAFAVEAHGPQQRKGTSIPYAAHVIGVASIALDNGADEDQAIAALLHDCVEDCAVTVETIAGRFGDRVARIVADCTDSFDTIKGEWRARKKSYISSLSSKPADSLLVSLSDKTHNARAIVDDLAQVGPSVWDRFKGGRAGSLWYYETLADAFDRLLPGPAADRFRRAVREMQRLAADDPALRRPA